MRDTKAEQLKKLETEAQTTTADFNALSTQTQVLWVITFFALIGAFTLTPYLFIIALATVISAVFWSIRTGMAKDELDDLRKRIYIQKTSRHGK